MELEHFMYNEKKLFMYKSPLSLVMFSNAAIQEQSKSYHNVENIQNIVVFPCWSLLLLIIKTKKFGTFRVTSSARNTEEDWLCS